MRVECVELFVRLAGGWADCWCLVFGVWCLKSATNEISTYNVDNNRQSAMKEITERHTEMLLLLFFALLLLLF